MNGEKTHFFDKPRNVKWVLRVFYCVCAALLLADCVHHRHTVHPWENLWGFFGIYGFIACVLLVLIAKEMRKVLMRDEDYYAGGSGGKDDRGDQRGASDQGSGG